MQQQRKWDTVKTVRRISTCPAPQGLCVIRAWANLSEDRTRFEGESEVLPAVAIQTTVTWSYYRATRAASSVTLSLVHKELIDDGWHFGDEETETAVLIVDDDFGLIEHNHTAVSVDNGMTIIAMRQDEGEFQAKVADLVQTVIGREQEKAERQAKLATVGG